MQTIIGYEYNGFAIPEEEAMKKIEYEVWNHDEDKQDAFDSSLIIALYFMRHPIKEPFFKFFF